MERARGVLSAVLGVIAALLILLSIAVVYVDRAVFDADQFTDRATVALDEPATQDAIQRALTDAIVEEKPDLIPTRAAIEFGVGVIVDSASFEAIFRRAVRESHRVFFEEDGGLVLAIGDVGQLVKAVVGASNPEIAEELPEELDSGLITLSEREFAADTLAAAEDVRVLAVILPLLALIATAAAFVVAVRRRRFVAIFGLTLALVLGIGLVTLGVLRGILTESFALGDVADEVWRAYLDDLGTALLLAIGGSVVVAAAAASLIFQYDLPRRARLLWAGISRPPERTLWRVLWALAIAVVGIVVALEPLAALKLVGVVAGIFLLFYGISQLMDVVDEKSGAGSAEAARGAFTGFLRGAVAAALALLLLIAGIVLLGGDGSADAAQRIEECNGHAELCDRPISAVAMAATHNSMSAAQDGFGLSMHDGGIVPQLDGGVRGLLIDTWYGIPKGDLVLTDLPASGVSEAEQAETYGQAAVDAAARLRAGSDASGERRTYMCHGWCELGALPLAEELAKIAEWLDANPTEVIVVVIQDAISPEDTAAAFEESGLLDAVYHHTPGKAFPTLREMIASGERVIVMAENETGDELDWYLQAYDYTQETPFRALEPADFTCRPDRGGTGKPFFLLNHWIEKPQPRAADAEIVNARDFLLGRARDCERARGVTPGLVAVNYWGIGDVIGVVDTLNGLDAGP